MSRPVFLASVLLLGVLCAATYNTTGTVSRAQGADLPALSLASPVTGFSLPVGITHAGDGSGRIFVLEQNGTIRIIKNGARLSTPFLDITSRTSKGGERGLLGLAFPPDYASKGYFYVNYTNTAGTTVIGRYRRSAANPDEADPNSEQIILTIAQPFENHNGGQLAFGPRDGFLYIGMGDGGSGGDPGNRAQNPNELLGKVLRIDVEGGRPYTYTVPASNPFVNTAGTRPEIWALGLRNPWRFSFDRLTADLFIADVGQSFFEEVNHQPAGSGGGENYGWRIMEGLHCHNPSNCSMTGLTLPVWEYGHGEGCSITGGYVYRGGEFPRMQGRYFYADFCQGKIWALWREGNAWQNSLRIDTPHSISTFGEDEAGNLYVGAYAGSGTIFKLVDTASPPAPIPPLPASVQFSAATFTAAEQAGKITATVTRTGDTAVPFTVDYATADATASERHDYITLLGTLRFAPGETTKTLEVLITDDRLVEGGEKLTLALSNPVGVAVLGPQATAELNITDNDTQAPSQNPIEISSFFVRQHYLDFLNREPDAAGFEFWTQNIELCGSDAFCRDFKRVDTSAAFFLAIEFQETGLLVYRMHKAAFGNVPGTPVPVRFRDFLRDTQEISKGVIVNVGEWRTQLERNKREFANRFVERPQFVSLYQTGQTPAQYVAALNANAGGALTPAEEANVAARLADGRETRASVLRLIAEDEDFERAEFNRAFVLMQYFGYLRRNPDDAPNTDFSGYNFWLDKLESFGGNFRAAEMVTAFIKSTEYRARFAP